MTIRLLIDENLDPQIAHILRTRGYDATSVSEALDLGAQDPTIAEYARSHQYVIVTNDRDFLDPDLKRGIPVLLIGDDSVRSSEIVDSIATVLEYAAGRNDLPPVLWL